MQPQEKNVFPPQHQNQHPGKESEMNPAPQYDNPNYKAAGKLQGKTAVITGGDSGIGRAVAVAFAKEGADVAIIYLNENSDADQTVADVTKLDRKCIKIAADLKCEQTVTDALTQAVNELGHLDILINNAGVQYPQNSISDITKDQLLHTFESNFFSAFYLTKAALPHLSTGSAIINTTSVTAFEGNPTLIDYSATKGAIVSFTRSMALSLVNQGVRVNAVAPGPVWTPLIVSSFSREKVQTFGSTTPMQRAAQPFEMAPLYVFLACEDSSDITGQVFHINSGTVIN
ncbi:NAD(P)-dependent dehydrogenase (short-subunit alcohol dehydrogenase family) [Hydrogenoanaerobacterium saccharovorans]|uniref:NAD(P)-dependent dehydrogenase, short-chain alcohol dehydrogenase family n=1 Tax=Hydrogenoanaerobacterium saccharovorans TaxID=474960 RepID=A0A1H7YN01_9FIRM|nr:SDR family oxidoreductase [Hydrogenoanaerobacterium saccharovorans]RPF49112.1 NAD(P)-dependent dehydrogenase (short-subunit alcohol dehydrogenase family) [Hydrogenoanaerobacterium saccharovorans]SEM47612.1 NAD(P)-dependent dehydrogenase, short-chain alcohol dehydrogenase family [Hydrogenoanaerobacterium saccharovorans]